MQSALDSAWPRLRLGRTLRDHGFLVLFHAAGLVAFLVLRADLTLHDFSGRIIGQATLDGVSIAARTGLYTRCLFLFLVAVAGLAWIARKVERVLGAKTLALLNLSSFAGCLMLYLTCWRMLAPAGVALVIAAEILIVVIALLDRYALRREVHPDAGRYTVCLLALGLTLIFPAYDSASAYLKAFGQPGLVAASAAFAVGLSLHIAVSLLARRRDLTASGRASDRLLHALMPLAALPLASVLRNEIHLCFNERGLYVVRPERVQVVLSALILVWCVVRFLRGPKRGDRDGRLDLEKLLGLWILPWMLVGIMSFNDWGVVMEPPLDFLEPGNPGLFIQQWFDFGRVPFFDTFSAHGLSDSFFGFIYCLIHGSKVMAWQHYDFLANVVAIFGIYHLFRRVMGSACCAFFGVMFLPYLDELFPPFAGMAFLVVFFVHWISTRTTARAWALFFAGMLLTFAWRLDIGFAATLAALATILAVRVAAPGYRLPISAILRGSGLALAVIGPAFLGICAWRSISPLTLLVDYQHMTSSNQAFGYTHIAYETSALVLWHLFVIPLLVLCAAAWLVVRSRGRLSTNGRTFFVFTAGIFLAAYVFANFPRGLVRHSFLEPDVTTISSFAFAVLGLAAYWTVGEHRPRGAFAAFVLITSLFGYNLSLDQQRASSRPATGTPYERTMETLVNIARPEGTDHPIARVVMPPWRRHSLERIQPFIENALAPEQTFLDLSNSPMLYYFTHKRSPHFANHLLLVHDEYTQKRVLEDLEREDLPFVTLVTEQDRCTQAGVPWLASLDGVPFQLRHYRLYQWVYEHFEPYALIQRWQVWVKKGWLSREPPAATTRAVEFSWRASAPADFEGSASAAEGPVTTLRLGQRVSRSVPAVALSFETAHHLCIEGRADQPVTLKLAWTARSVHGLEHFERSLVFPAGSNLRYYVLPGERGIRPLESLELDWEGAFDLLSFALVRSDAAECIDITKRVHMRRTLTLGHVAQLWGEDDVSRAQPLTTLAELQLTEGTPAPEHDTPVANLTQGTFDRGVSLERAGICLDIADEAEQALCVGDSLRLADGSERTVEGIEGRHVWLAGARLSAADVGYPHSVRCVTPRPQGAWVTGSERRQARFEPIVDRSHGTYLLMKARAPARTSARIIVHYGQGEESLGTFVFTPVADDKPHEYAVRLSLQYNWYHRPSDWISIGSSGGPIEILSASLADGD